jgi:hypothetical protein
MARGDRMLAVFCLRLAAGMMGCLLFLPARLINQRFYRTHFLTVLALALGPLFLADVSGAYVWPLRLTLSVALVLAFAGSFVWSLEGAPAGRTIIVLCTMALVGGLTLLEIGESSASSSLDVGVARLVGGFTSAAVLGAAMTAMLMGHSYLVAPQMSLLPLLRLIGLLAVALGVRMVADGSRFWWWTQRFSSDTLGNDTLLVLPVRWLVGLLLPLGLGWMAWQTTRIRSTQSSTGILYVVVIFVFLGELMTLLLREKGVTL